MRFIKQLQASWKSSHSLLCVGLDPDLQRFPETVGRSKEGIFTFNQLIIDATHDLVCAYKPQVAYFSALGAERQLEQTIEYIKSRYPNIPVILDAKRGDIGSTASQYAKEAFHRYQADAVTVNPYMGFDAVKPFLDYQDKGIIVLCKTSNTGAGQLQEACLDGEPVYEYIAKLVANEWNFNANCLLVMGATWPEQVARVRRLVGDMPFLVPGAGEQGGDIGNIVRSGQTRDGTGLIISASRSILYAGEDAAFAEAARAQAILLKHTINRHRVKNAATL